MNLCKKLLFLTSVLLTITLAQCSPLEGNAAPEEKLCYNCVGSVEECGDVSKPNVQQMKCESPDSKCATYFIKHGSDDKTAIIRTCDANTDCTGVARSEIGNKEMQNLRSTRVECEGTRCNKDVYTNEYVLEKAVSGSLCSNQFVARYRREDATPAPSTGGGSGAPSQSGPPGGGGASTGAPPAGGEVGTTTSAAERSLENNMKMISAALFLVIYYKFF